jgi:hypothetical protein
MKARCQVSLSAVLSLGEKKQHSLDRKKFDKKRNRKIKRED